MTQPLLDIVLYNALFFTSLALSAAAIATSVPCFADERALFNRERGSGASTCAYVMGKVTIWFYWSHPGFCEMS
jgi:hypothetical protein